LDFDEFFEKLAYGEATQHMSQKAKYKLANLMTHGYEIEHTHKMTVITRRGESLMVGSDGQLYRVQKVV
tara:strand:+ start:443 stop:649 length:207 start_codon:yes stop_codon:yes gene_type:complete